MSFSQDTFIEMAKEQQHSEEFINICIAYANHLQSKNLPVIFTRAHLGMLLGINNISHIILNRNAYYKFYEIKKRNGKGFRQIVTPYSNLKFIQQYIQAEILAKIEVGTHANGFVKGKSIVSNATPHQRTEAILNLDLSRFFDSIRERRVYGIFRSLGYAKNLAVDLAKLCTVELPEAYLDTFAEKELHAYRRIVRPGDAVLPQGAPTSPTLSNLILRRLDRRLNGLAKKQAVNYTRYADDITFSGSLNNLPPIKLIRHIVKSEGLNINWDKVGIFRKGRRQVVTGLTISDGLHVPRSFKKEVKKHLHCCVKFGVEAHLHFLGISEKKFYKEWLLGKIYYIKAVEPAFAETLLKDFNTIAWPI
jgi:RNA-directed DNA polymerase